jgi:hypothetical protein
MMSLSNLSILFWGYALETAEWGAIQVHGDNTIRAMAWQEAWLSFLSVWGCESYVKKLQPGKLEAKLENASLQDIQGKPLDIPSTIRPKAKHLLLRLEPLSRKSFSPKV